MANEGRLGKQRIGTCVYNSDSKIAYSNPDVNKTALEFNRLILSNKTDPAEKLQKGWPSIGTEATILIKVPDNEPRKEITVQQPITVELAPPETNTEATSNSCSERSVLDGRQDHISELEQRFSEAIMRLQEKVKEIRDSKSSGMGRRPDQTLEIQQRMREVIRLQVKIKEVRDGERALLDQRQDHILKQQRLCGVKMPLQKKLKQMSSESLKITKNKQVSIRNGYLNESMHFKNKIRTGAIQLGRSRTAISEGLAMTGSVQRKTMWCGSRQVQLSGILKKIVNHLFEDNSIAYLFQKPITAKEAPDYLDIVKRPMELSTIRTKVNRMEYKSHKEFRHDVLQIAFNAHRYNDGRNPRIPPLADLLLQLCDQLLEQHKSELEQAEAEIASTHRSDLWGF